MKNLNIIDILADADCSTVELSLNPENRVKLREIRAYIEHDEELVDMEVNDFEHLSAEEVSRLSGRHLDPDLSALHSAEIANHEMHPASRIPSLAGLALAMVASFCAVGIIFLMSHMPSNTPTVDAATVVPSGPERTELDHVALTFSGLGSPLFFDLNGFNPAVSEPPSADLEIALAPPEPSFLEGFSALRLASSRWAVRKSEDLAVRVLQDTFQIPNRAAVDILIENNGWVASVNDLNWRTTLFSFEITDELFSPYRAAPAAGLDSNQSHVLTQLLVSTDLVDTTELPPGAEIFGILVSRPNEPTYPLVWVELKNGLIPVQTCLEGIPELGGFLSGFSDVGACGELLEIPSVSSAGHYDGTAFMNSSDVSAASFAPTIVRAAMCSGESC